MSNEALLENPSSTHELNNDKHLIFKYKGTPWRTADQFYEKGIQGLHQEVNDFYKYMRPTPEEKFLRHEVLTRITDAIEWLWKGVLVRE